MVVLGQGAPNQLKDKRISKCVSAICLDDMELYRIYPVPQGWLRRWQIFSVEVEKNPRDHRENTWKIKNSKVDWKKLSKYITVEKKDFPKSKREELIRSIKLTTLGELRKNEKSFGIIKPKIIDFELDKRNESTSKQCTLDDINNLDEGFCIINQADYKYKPYVVYECEGNCDCKNKTHRQQILEWGCYEFMRKNSGKEINLKDNLRLFDPEWDIFFLLGNIHKSKKTYVIVSILRFKKKKK